MDKNLHLPGWLQNEQYRFDHIKVWKLATVKTAMNYRARKRGCFGNITIADLVNLINKQNGLCFYCGRRVKIYDDNRHKDDSISFDHVIPMCKGGSNTPDNLVMSCLGCNRKRNHKEQLKQNIKPNNITNWVAYVR
jgi:5-methylcytosine-specific restriction endonuclease McrA